MPEEICTLRTRHNLNTLWADCVPGDFTKVSCEITCCTKCFDSDIQEQEATTNTPSASPPADVYAGPTQYENQLLRSFLLGHMDGFEQRLEDTASPTYKAYQWLGSDDAHITGLDDFRKLQRFGLATLYLSTSVELGWKVSNLWLSPEHECGWYGISCALNDTVTSISLPSNRLTGTIPPEIALAAIGGKVRVLNLAGNDISGSIVEQLGTMTHLELLGRLAFCSLFVWFHPKTIVVINLTLALIHSIIQS
jgi:hypothetical protein